MKYIFTVVVLMPFLLQYTFSQKQSDTGYITVEAWRHIYNSNGISEQVPISQLPWKHVATKMPDEWYGSEESKKVAENVLLYQRDAGGWPKNIPIHNPLSEAEKAKVNDDKGNNDAIF